MLFSFSIRSRFLLLLLGTALFQRPYNLLGLAKEVEVTKEWQLLGENDTIPAGMHVRMDMTTGEKWVKQIDEDEEDDVNMAAAIIQEDGSVQVQQAAEKKKADKAKRYDYDVMYRTLDKLPEQEKERIGGLPELPSGSGGSTPLTSKERQFFEKRMAEIWEKRQEELKEAQEYLVDFPEVLKERIKSIRDYLKDPATHLKGMNLDKEPPEGMTTHIVSVLQDLEYLLTDVDNARDFHTLGGWPLLVSLLSEEVHVPQNKTISKLSRKTEAKIRAVQAHAAWAIGTTVKNTGEFSPFAIEELILGEDYSTGRKTTPIDLLIDTFCKDYKDANSWEVRTLLAKSIYGIGSLLRGNRMAQAHVVSTNNSDGPTRLADKLRQFSLARFTSTTTKLVQRLLSLAADLVSGVQSQDGNSDDDASSLAELKDAVIQSFTSADWCDATSKVLVTDSLLPVPVQETLLQTIAVLAPHCTAWKDKREDLRLAISKLETEWQKNSNDFDAEHLEELMTLAKQAMESLEKAATNN
jgi:nucleotide exchange factor SIL1